MNMDRNISRKEWQLMSSLRPYDGFYYASHIVHPSSCKGFSPYSASFFSNLHVLFKADRSFNLLTEHWSLWALSKAFNVPWTNWQKDKDERGNRYSASHNCGNPMAYQRSLVPRTDTGTRRGFLGTKVVPSLGSESAGHGDGDEAQ